MSEIKQEILDLLILNGRKPQTIKSGERVVYLYDALNIVNKEFSKIEQPQLNENQQIVLEWLKKSHFDSYFKAVISNLFFWVRNDSKDDLSFGGSHEMVVAYEELSGDEFAQVLEEFSKWAQEQEAE